MRNLETREHNCYTAHDFVCDVAMVVVLIGAAFGLLQLVGSF